MISRHTHTSTKPPESISYTTVTLRAHRYANSKAAKKPKQNSKIYLLPVVETPEDVASFPSVQSLISMVHSFFGLPVELMPPRCIRTLGGVTSRTMYGGDAKWKQYNAGSILAHLAKHRPKDAHTLCAFTMLVSANRLKN